MTVAPVKETPGPAADTCGDFFGLDRKAQPDADRIPPGGEQGRHQEILTYGCARRLPTKKNY